MSIYNCIHFMLQSNEFKVFIGFVLFDILTGTLLSFKEHRVMSKVNKNGITKHFTIILFIIFLAIVFSIMRLEDYFNLLVYFYIASYGLSILENLGGLGVPFPLWLKERFVLLKGETNEIKKFN